MKGIAMSESKLRVNRTKELELVIKSMHPQVEDSVRVLVFHGHGGRGKTGVREILESELLTKEHLPYLLIDFENTMFHTCETTFGEMRNQLRPWNVDCPTFDKVWRRYRQAQTHQSEPNILIPQTAQDLNTIVGGPLKKFEAGTNLARRAFKNVRDRIVDSDIGDYSVESIAAIRNKMPAAMAQDLEAYAKRRRETGSDGGGSRLVVMFDGFEQLFKEDTKAWNSQWREDWRSDWFVRQFCQNTELVLPIIFGREANTVVASWQTHYDFRGRVRFYEVGLLSEEDCFQYFLDRGIRDPTLASKLYELTRGYAGHMALAADICVRFRQRMRRDPSIEEFGVEESNAPIWARLLTRLLRQLSDEEKDAIKLAAVPRYFTPEIFRSIMGNSPATNRLFSTVTAYSFVSSSTQESRAFRIVEEPRALLKRNARSDRREWLEWNSRLRDYHWQWPEQLQHLSEGLYHEFIVDEKAALSRFSQLFFKAVYDRRLLDAEMILQSFPQDESLSDETAALGKLAQAYLLQTFWRSDQELVTAARAVDEILSKDLAPEVMAVATHIAAVIKEKDGDRPGALPLLRQSLSIYEELNDPAMLSWTYHLVGNLLFATGDSPLALEAHEKGDRVFEALGANDEEILEKSGGGVLSGVELRRIKRDGMRSTAGFYARVGKSLEAEAQFRELLSVALDANELRAIAEEQSELAMVVRRLGRLQEAEVLYRDSLARFEELRDWVGAANALCGLGLTAEMAGDDQEAKSYFEQSIALFNQLADKHGQAKLSQTLGRIASRANEQPEAGSLLQFALDTYTTIGKHSFAGSVKLDIAESQLTSAPSEGLPLLLELLELVNRLDDKPAIAAVNTNLGTVYDLLEDRERACKYWAAAIAEYKAFIAVRPPIALAEPMDETIFARTGPYPLWISHMYFHVPEVQDEMLKRLQSELDCSTS